MTGGSSAASEDEEEPAIRHLLGLLSVSIGALMEDESTEAIMALPENPEGRFAALATAGRDITALAEAGLVIVRRRQIL